MKLLNFIRFLFLSSETKRAIHTAVLAVQGLKNALDSPIAVAVDSIIPGHVTDSFVYKAVKSLLETLKELELYTEDEKGWSSIYVNKAVESIKSFDGDKGQLYRDIAGGVAAKLTGKENLGEGIEGYYKSLS